MTLQQFLALGAVIILAINCGGGGNQQGNVCQEDNECPPTQFCFNGYCVAASGQSGITVDPVDQNAGSEEMTVSDSRSDKSSPQLDKALSDVVLGTAADAGDAGGATPDMLDVTEAPDVSETDTLADKPTPDGSESAVGCFWIDITACIDTGGTIAGFCPDGTIVKTLERCDQTFYTPPSGYLAHHLCGCPKPNCDCDVLAVDWKAVECCPPSE